MFGDTFHIERALQQHSKRRVVEHRGSIFGSTTGADHGCEEAHAMARQRCEVSAIDVGNVDVSPPAHQARDTASKVVGMDRQRGRVDRAGRCAADHRKRTSSVLAEGRSDRTQRTGLISRTRAAAGQHQPRVQAGFHRRWACLPIRA